MAHFSAEAKDILLGLIFLLCFLVGLIIGILFL
jgi:hypothetical protein